MGHGSQKTQSYLKCSLLLPRAVKGALFLGEVVQHPKGPAVVALTLLQSAADCERDAKGLFGQAWQSVTWEHDRLGIARDWDIGRNWYTKEGILIILGDRT